METKKAMKERLNQVELTKQEDSDASDREDESEVYESSEADEDEEDEDVETDVSDDDEESSVLVMDPYDEKTLPEYACRYCGIHDPACVAKCVETKKWFCNATCPGSGGSHLVNHLVRSRNNQVQLHPESPLGDTVLECYNCASKNAFVLGFVPASTNSVVVLLCRVCVETVPALKDMDWELQQWCPLVQNRAFLPWLIKVNKLFTSTLAIYSTLTIQNLYTSFCFTNTRYPRINSCSKPERFHKPRYINWKICGKQNRMLDSQTWIVPMSSMRQNLHRHCSIMKMGSTTKMSWRHLLKWRRTMISK